MSIAHIIDLLRNRAQCTFRSKTDDELRPPGRRPHNEFRRERPAPRPDQRLARKYRFEDPNMDLGKQAPVTPQTFSRKRQECLPIPRV
jgi:hypothetical protein